MSDHSSRIGEMLEAARARLERLGPAAAQAAMRDGSVLIDIRSDSQRDADGVVPDAIFIPRNVLEWRCEPGSPWRDERIPQEARVIVMCDEGYQSSLAAATLRGLGADATDLAGGFQAWRAAGLPVSR